MRKLIPLIMAFSVFVILFGLICGSAPVSATTPVGANVAMTGYATATGTTNDERPERAVDGVVVNNSKWCYDSPYDKWLEVELQGSNTITRWVVKHAGYGGEPTSWNTQDFQLQYSYDNTTWYTADSVVGNTANITDRTVTPFCAKYVRLYITSATQEYGNNCARIYEFEVYNTTNCTALKTYSGNNYDQYHPIPNTFDNNDSTYWTSCGSYYNHFGLDFEGLYPIDTVVIKHAGSGGFDPYLNTRDFKISLWSTDTLKYTTTITGNTSNISELRFPPVVATRLEIEILTPTQSGNPNDPATLFEVEAYTYSPNPIDVVIDNDSSLCAFTGTWTRNTTSYLDQRFGGSYHYYYLSKIFDPNTKARFNANVMLPGYYHVYSRWTGSSGRNTATPYVLYPASDATPINFTVNQNLNPGQWNYLGSFYLEQFQGALEVKATQGYYTIADAARFRYIGTNYHMDASAIASSTLSGYSVSKVNDGVTNTAGGPDYSWVNSDALPQWVELDFPGMRTFNTLVLYTTAGYELKDYDIQYWDVNTNSWLTITSVTNNTQARRETVLKTVRSNKVRIIANSGPLVQTNYARINEIQVQFIEPHGSNM